MTDISESVEPSEVNPQIDALDRVSEDDKTDAALDSLAHGLMGTQPATEPESEKEEGTPEAEAKPEESKEPPVKVKVGDDELPLDEVVAGYMKEKDYRQKTQALAEERRKIAAYEQHIKNLESDPAYVAHVKAYHQRQAEAQAPKPPDDPIEAIKWEAAQLAKREIEQQYAPLIQQLQAKQTIDGVRAQVMRDPLFDETQAAILNMVQNLPPSVRDLTYAKLDADPNAYMETYADARKWVEAQKSSKAKGEPEQKAEEEKKPEPVARRERAPLLETSKRVPTASEEASKTKRLTEIRKSLKSGVGIADDDLFEYFDLAGITAKLS